MYRKDMEKGNQNIYILNIYMSHFRDKQPVLFSLRGDQTK